MTFGWDLALGAICIIVLLVVMAGLALLAKTSFFGSVILGADGRTSTSKTFVFMWTLLIGWVIVSLVIAGEIVPAHKCVTHGAQGCTAAKDKLGLMQVGWRHFLSTGLIGSYMVLLGIPAASAVGAKVTTQAKVASNSITKPPVNPAKSSFASKATQIFSADDGTTDIGDLQYTIFNLVTAAYFIAHVINDPSKGLPPIPDTLLGLTSVSAALYVSKKAATSDKPSITGVFPASLRAGTRFVVTGTGLTPYPGGPPGSVPRITVNDKEIPGVQVDPSDATRLKATVPATGLLAPGQAGPVAGKLIVLTAYGQITPSYVVELE